MPPTAFLFSIAGLSVTLAGFSGLVAAFRRGAEWKPIDSYRLRQIPEMGLATALVVLSTIPLSDTFHNTTVTLQIAGGIALLFTVTHIAVLLTRSRDEALHMSAATIGWATLIDLSIVGLGAGTLALGGAAAFEWLLVAMLARPMLAFVLVLAEVPSAR